MENIEICCSHNVGIDGKDFTPECDCSCHQPIEEKWKGSWRWRSDRMGLDKDQHDEILDFIENLLEQEREKSSDAKFHFTNGVLEERKRMSDEIEKRKMDGYCKDENCSHDECGTIRWFNKGLNISLSIINK